MRPQGPPVRLPAVHRALSLVVLALFPVLARAAVAAEGTDIASAMDEDDPFDLFVGVDYAYEARRASIKREFAGPDGVEDEIPGKMPLVKDLLYSQGRHILTPHLALGLFTGVQLSLALPIVISDDRKYEFDQRGDPCVFVNSETEKANCVNKTNSRTLQEGILPGAGGEQIGYDAKDPATNFAQDSTTVFRGVSRAGLDQLHLGLTFAPMRQEYDDTKPTWVIGAEGRLSIGKIMKFNLMNPESQDGVSRGVHEVRVFTGLSKRTTWAEPFVFFWWQAPFAIRGTTAGDADGSLFWDVGFGQRERLPQQRAGTRFGLEAIPWEKPKHKQKIAIELVGRLEAHFDGQGYSEMWEPFAYAGDLKDNPGGPLVIQDIDFGKDEAQAFSHPGVTHIQNYLTFAGRMGLRGYLGPNAQFLASFELAHDQAHLISFTDAGVDAEGLADPNGEDDTVDGGTAEANPLHNQSIDLTGRRYLVDETTVYTVLISGLLTF